MLKQKIYRIFNSAIIVLLLSIYGLILVNNSLFYHSHVTSDGKVISHAHPFSKQNDDKPFKAHHHSKLELLLLFSDNYNTNELQSIVKVIPITSFENYLAHNSTAVLSKIIPYKSGRAPPQIL